MELLLKALNGSGALAVIALVVVGFATFGMGWLRMLRELQGDKDRLLAQRDMQLADLRREKADLDLKYKALAVTAAKLENRTVAQGAVLYGNVIYIRRLEKGYRDRGEKLPPRDGPDESG